jgi:hypothetical protein
VLGLLALAVHAVSPVPSWLVLAVVLLNGILPDGIQDAPHRVSIYTTYDIGLLIPDTRISIAELKLPIAIAADSRYN